MSHPIAFFEIVSDAPDRARTFYEALFSWSTSVDDDGYALVDTGDDDDAVAGGIGPSMTSGDTGIKIYVRTDDLETTLAKVADLGGSEIVPPMALPGDFGRIAVFADPDGNPVGLWS